MHHGDRIRVGGVWLDSLAGCGELEWSDRWGHGGAGCHEASWLMDLPPKFSHRALRAGQLVEIMVGPRRVWYGRMGEPDRGDGWEFHAAGLSRVADRTLCLNGSGDATSRLDTAIDQAITRGALPGWTRPVSLSNDPYAESDETDQLNYLTDLANGVADEEGKTWGVGPDGAVFLSANPTTPKWHLVPGAGAPGVADDDYATHLYGRYRNTTTLAYTTATAGDDAQADRFGRVEFPVDLTSLGPISGTRAGNVLAGILAKGKARLGWTEALEPSLYQMLTPGGVPADPRMVFAGDMVRLHGVADESQATTLTIDIVIGEKTYASGDDVLSLAPAKLAARGLEDVLTSRGFL